MAVLRGFNTFLHRLKPLDIEFMKQLHEKVNIVPVIGKADTLTPEETAEFKATVSKRIALVPWKLRNKFYPVTVESGSN